MLNDLQTKHLEHVSRIGVRSTLLGMAVNTCLAIVKGIAGVIGNSYALIADAIESAADVVTSFVVLLGVRMAGKPADTNHPYGHGKFEPLAAALVSLTLLGAAVLIMVESVREILTPHHAPEPFTLAVLLGVILIKEALARYVVTAAEGIGSVAVKTDAFHHRADAITSAAAFIGISIAVFGGPGFEIADDIAAVVAAVVIAINALILFRPALSELIDTAPAPEIAESIRSIALRVPGVLGTHKCGVRKVGFVYFVDLDVLCNPNETIRHGHEVAHNVGEAIHSALPAVAKVLVHVEPADDFGRRSRDMVV
jgi:cation diffusion facilitator family transporter